MDDTSLESLKWLISEAKEKYNTTITLHVNFSDAYTDDDPLSPEMLKNQLFIRNSDGSLREMSMGWAGHKGYYVSAPANYFTGNWQNNIIKPLLTMLPELEGQSIHPDAWYSHSDPYYGLTSYDTTDAQRRSAQYLRETYGMDLTTEFDVAFGAGEKHPEDHILYFPMIWQRGWCKTDPLMTPSYIQSGVNELAYDGVTLSASGRYFGEGTAVEPNLWIGTYGPVELPGLKQSFAEKELTRQYLNTLLRSTLTDNEETGGEAVLYAGDGTKVVSAWNGDDTIPYKRTVTVGDDVVLQEPGNVFMPMTWRAGLEIQAWSKDGYTDKSWKLPEDWEEVESVDLYDLSVEGLRYVDTKEVTDRGIVMSMSADQTMVIVPHGQDPNSTEGFEQNGTVQFVGKDTKTSGNWTENYGSEGYELFDGELGAEIPKGIELSYVNGTVETIQTGIVVTDAADKEDLSGLIAYAQSQKENEDYQYVVPAVKAAFEEALAEAVTVNENEAATQAEVDAAYDRLLDMVHMLSFTGNSESLQALVDVAAGMNPDLYTETTWAAVEEALEQAEAVLANENALQKEIDAARDALQAAIDALEKIPVDKSKLRQLVEKAKEYEDTIDKYTPSTGELFTAVLKDARDVLADEDVLQQEVEAAYSALQNAIWNLRLIPDKSVLEELIKEAEAVDTSNYTEASAAVFKMALANAKAVYADAEATEDEAKAAESELREAQDNLVAKGEEPSGGDNDNDDTDNNDGDNSNSGNTDNNNAGNTGDNTDNANSGSSAETPKTGDASPIMPLVMLGGLSLASALVVISAKKKRKG